VAIENTYRYDLDMLKGLAIIAVVLYHAGWCKSGYLGVDLFLVLNGYFVVPQVIGQIEEGRFRYWAFVEKKIFRFLPLVSLVSALSLAVGYCGMLPGDLRFLSEETIATSVFMNNLLQAITTQNYWAAIYHKVLMHTWFLGVLMQFYIVFPILMLLFRKWMWSVLIVFTILSFMLYLLPIDTIGDKYYLLPYRFFEIAAGGIIAIRARKESRTLSDIAFGLLVLMIFLGAFTIGERVMPYNLEGGTNTIRESFLPREVILLLTVIFTLLYVYSNSSESHISSFAKHSKILAPSGRMSLSIFLWHQPLFAFYRYFYADEISFPVLIVIIAMTLFLSFITFRLIENYIRVSKMTRICLILSFFVVNSFALHIYQLGGAVRDVPELDIRTGEYDPAYFERYTDRIYQYDHEFSSSKKGKKILVIGNSFARDFANILLESTLADSIQLSYHYDFEKCPLSRIRQCDRIYFFGWKHQVPNVVWHNLRSHVEIWGISTKNHGTSNGIFYKNRHHTDYFAQRTLIKEDFHTVNHLLRDEWQSHYVDLLSLALQSDGTVPVFTPDHHFITYDGRHLTPAGVRYYFKLVKDNM